MKVPRVVLWVIVAVIVVLALIFAFPSLIPQAHGDAHPSTLTK